MMNKLELKIVHGVNLCIIWKTQIFSRDKLHLKGTSEWIWKEFGKWSEQSNNFM